MEFSSLVYPKRFLRIQVETSGVDDAVQKQASSLQIKLSSL